MLMHMCQHETVGIVATWHVCTCGQFKLIGRFNPPMHVTRLALVVLLNAKLDSHVCLIGLLCSSFVAINRGTNKRYPHAPLGDESCKSVQVGNCLCSRILGLLGLIFVCVGLVLRVGDQLIPTISQDIRDDR